MFAIDVPLVDDVCSPSPGPIVALSSRSSWSDCSTQWNEKRKVCPTSFLYKGQPLRGTHGLGLAVVHSDYFHWQSRNHSSLPCKILSRFMGIEVT
jgi:hypothetical protein